MIDRKALREEWDERKQDGWASYNIARDKLTPLVLDAEAVEWCRVHLERRYSTTNRCAAGNVRGPNACGPSITIVPVEVEE